MKSVSAYLIAASLSLVLPFYAAPSETLPGTTLWAPPADIATEQYRELRTYFEKSAARFAEHRTMPGKKDEARERFRKLLGAADPFLPRKPAVSLVTTFGPFQASLVEWPILRTGTEPSTVASAGAVVREYGILLTPQSQGKHAAVVVVPDAMQSAADLAGLTRKHPVDAQIGRTLASRGFVVFVPFFVQRRAFSEPWTNDRSWLFRLGYQVGRHLIGSEVQQVSAAREYLGTLPTVDARRITVAGAGQGGLTALYAAALDKEFDGALVTGYFDARSNAFNEPEDRMVWNLLRDFGDAEIASLVAPRELWVEGGGPSARAELVRARSAGSKWVEPGSGLTTLASEYALTTSQPNEPESLMDPDEIARISNAQFTQWQARYRNLAIEAYRTRESAWQADTSSPGRYQAWAAPKREQYWDIVGRFPQPGGALEAQSVRVYDEEAFAGYRLSVKVYEGVYAYGILLVPKNIRPGDKRPVVFTQHGLAGKPEDALGVIPNPPSDNVYSRFGKRLAERGYVVFAPMISTQSGAERDAITRRAHLVGQTPVGMEVKKFGRVLDFLATLPFVDAARTAFYGLSYGGYTALWTGPGEPRFRVVIASGHFNDWDIKTSDPTLGTSFLFYTPSLDMFNFDVLSRFSHSELAMLVAPRSFLIEVGDRDGIVIAPRRFADAEMERVLALYRRLGIPERAAIARFDGPHKVDGHEAFLFLDRWLGWKPPNGKARL